MSTKPTIISEKELPAFRREVLSPQSILKAIEEQNEIEYEVAVGVGKSTAIDNLLSNPETYEKYECVICVSPTHAIIDERLAALKKSGFPIKHAILEPRPRKRCGDFDERWSHFEKKGCTSYAKEVLCEICPERTAKRPCKWPRGLKKKINGASVIFCTEQYFVVDGAFLFRLRRATDAEKILIIFDEAKLSHNPFEFKITAEEIRIFAETLRVAKQEEPKAEKAIDQWIESLDLLLSAENSEIIDVPWNFPFELNYFATAIQEIGYQEFGKEFRYLGHALAGFKYSRRPERWKSEAGVLCFILRPYLKTDVLILSANLRLEYVAKQLGLKKLKSPLAHIKFKHSKTKLYNLKSLLGAEKYFFKNHRQILDFFATLIYRNIQNKERTLLISRKKFKKLSAHYIEQRLRSWGLPHKVKIYKNPKSFSAASDSVVILHYGVLGINLFEDFENCFCLNSYYIPDYELNRALQSAEPEKFRVEVQIKRDALGNRSTSVDPKYAFSDLVRLGNLYLRVLEVDPAIQAAGRVRFFTRPRTVIFFQLHDLSVELGEVTELRNLAMARKVLDIPKASELDRRGPISKIKNLRNNGLSIRAISKKLKIPSSTISRWLKTTPDCSTFPYKEINKEKWDSDLKDKDSM